MDDVWYDQLESSRPQQKYLYNFKANSNFKINLDTMLIWGICLNGVPYINQSRVYLFDPSNAIVQRSAGAFIFSPMIPKRWVNEYAQVFTRIMFIGSLCFFNAEGDRTGFPLEIVTRIELNKYRIESHKEVNKQYLLQTSTG